MNETANIHNSTYISKPSERRWIIRKQVPMKVNIEDIKLIAPYLWARQDRQEKQAYLSFKLFKIICVHTNNQIGICREDKRWSLLSSTNNYYSLDIDKIEDLSQRLYQTCNALKESTNSANVKLFLVDHAQDEFYYCPNVKNSRQEMLAKQIRWPIGNYRVCVEFMVWLIVNIYSFSVMFVYT